MDEPESQLKTGPLRGLPSLMLSGLEHLDLDTDSPQATDHLSCPGGYLASYDRDEEAWRIQETGHILVNISIGQKHGIVLIPELRRVAGGEDAERAILTLKINGYEWNEGIDPLDLKFNKQSWYLPHYKLSAGTNIISIGVRRGAGSEVLIKSVAVMRFHLDLQRKENWCWAAVTASIVNFLDKSKSLSQCEVVNHCFSRHAARGKPPDCCREGESKACDQPFSLSDALEDMGLRVVRCNFPLTLRETRQQIESGVPVALRIEWNGGGAHFVVITAVGPEHADGEDSTWIRVADPNDQAASYIPFGKLRDKYKGDGRWTYSYLVRR